MQNYQYIQEIFKKLILEVDNRIEKNSFLGRDIRRSSLEKIKKQLLYISVGLEELWTIKTRESIVTRIIVFEEERKDFYKYYSNYIFFYGFVGVFSVLEDSISQICFKKLGNQEHNELKFEIFELIKDKEVTKFLIDNSKLDKEKMEKIKSETSFIPISRKAKALCKKGYMENDDIDFIEFCCCIRNTVHNNGYYIKEYNNRGDEKYTRNFGTKFSKTCRNYKFENEQYFMYEFPNDFCFWIEKIINLLISLNKKLSDDFGNGLIEDKTFGEII